MHGPQSDPSPLWPENRIPVPLELNLSTEALGLGNLGKYGEIGTLLEMIRGGGVPMKWRKTNSAK